MKQRQRLYATKPGHEAPQRAATPARPAPKGWGREPEPAVLAPAATRVSGHQIGRMSVFPARLPRVGMHAPPVFLDLDDEPHVPGADAPGFEALGEPEELEEPGGAPKEKGKEKESGAAGCGETVAWQPDSPVPVDISADSAAEFLAKANAALGNPHMVGAESHQLDLTNGRVTKVNMQVTTSIVRPRWTGGRKVSDTESALIRRMVEFIKAHEERHRDAYRKVMQDAVCAALGKTGTAAQAAITKANCTTTPAAHEAIDGSEGKLELVKDGSGAVTDFKAVGVTVSYREKDCK